MIVKFLNIFNQLTDYFEKIKNFCAYQERCIFDVKKKLYDFGITNEKADKIIKTLIRENFIDENRFCKMFSSGKFNTKKWGRIKISSELLKRNIPYSLIQKALDEIDENDYYITLQDLILKKSPTIKETDQGKKKYKLINYALSKGYETELVMKVIGNNYIENP